MIDFTDENFEQEVLKSNQIVLVDFWSPGCMPCLVMGPIIEVIAEEFKGRIKVGKLNVSENMQTARNYGILGVPTLLIFKNGKPIEKAVGLRPKETLTDKLNSLLADDKNPEKP